MEQQLAYILNTQISVLALILAAMVLDLLLIFRELHSNLRCFIETSLQLFGMACPAPFCQEDWEDLEPKGLQPDPFPADESRVDQVLDCKSVDHEVKLTGVEVKLVMDRLGIPCHTEEANGISEGVGSVQIEELFDEQEPSLEEVKEAFNVFDKNRDGFIDARELCSLLSSFGYLQISEDICRGMIRTFDDSGDGLIDLKEFTKLVEKGLN